MEKHTRDTIFTQMRRTQLMQRATFTHFLLDPNLSSLAASALSCFVCTASGFSTSKAPCPAFFFLPPKNVTAHKLMKIPVPAATRTHRGPGIRFSTRSTILLAGSATCCGPLPKRPFLLYELMILSAIKSVLLKRRVRTCKYLTPYLYDT